MSSVYIIKSEIPFVDLLNHIFIACGIFTKHAKKMIPNPNNFERMSFKQYISTVVILQAISAQVEFPKSFSKKFFIKKECIS